MALAGGCPESPSLDALELPPDVAHHIPCRPLSIDRSRRLHRPAIKVFHASRKDTSHGAQELQETEGVAVNLLQILLDRPPCSTPSLPGSTHNFRDDELLPPSYSDESRMHRKATVPAGGKPANSELESRR